MYFIYLINIIFYFVEKLLLGHNLVNNMTGNKLTRWEIHYYYYYYYYYNDHFIVTLARRDRANVRALARLISIVWKGPVIIFPPEAEYFSHARATLPAHCEIKGEGLQIKWGRKCLSDALVKWQLDVCYIFCCCVYLYYPNVPTMFKHREIRSLTVTRLLLPNHLIFR